MSTGLYRVEDKIRLLETADSNGNLSPMISNVLQGMMDNVLVPSEYPSQFVVDVFRAAPAMQAPIKEAISELLCNYLREFQDLSYMYHLLYLAGRLGVSDSKSMIARTQLLLEKKFIDRYPDLTLKQYREDLHTILLKSLLPYIYAELGTSTTLSRNIMKVCLEAVSASGIATNPKHFPICYLILDRIDAECSNHHFDNLVHVCMQNGFNLGNILRQCINTDVLVEHVSRRLDTLKGERDLIIVISLLRGITTDARYRLSPALRQVSGVWYGNISQPLWTTAQFIYLNSSR